MSDVILDNGEQVTVLCNNLAVHGHDLLLDSPGRRKPDGPKFRRAIVHNSADGLTINFADDYPGGVTINGIVELNTTQPGGDIKISFFHPDEVDPNGVIGKAGFSETLFLGELFTTLRNEIGALKDRVAALEKARSTSPPTP
jgi:hypothetical protein